MIIFEKINPFARIPERKSEGAAGLDIYAVTHGVLYPGGKVIIPTGIKCQLPDHVCLQIWCRSGLAADCNLSVEAGLIDADYRGEIKIILRNHYTEGQYGKRDTIAFKWEVGDRIAQIVPLFIYQGPIGEGTISETARGDGGFGSTGK